MVTISALTRDEELELDRAPANCSTTALEALEEAKKSVKGRLVLI